MKTSYRAFGYIMAANAEALGVLLFSWWLGKTLNQHFPSESMNWMIPTMLFALIMIGLSWYRLLRSLIKDQQAEEKPRNPPSSGKNNA